MGVGAKKPCAHEDVKRWTAAQELGGAKGNWLRIATPNATPKHATIPRSGAPHMTLIRRLALILTLLAPLLAAGRAGATDRAGFFEIGKRPTIAFDKKTLTWTLHNQSVERIVRFDPARGSLSTTLLRDLRRHRDVAQAPGGECSLSFATRLLDTPVQLPAGWKMAQTPPDSDRWTRPDYDDTAWKTVDAPASAGPAAWFRRRLPALQRGHSYALVVAPGGAGRIDVFVDGTAAQGPQVDLAPGSSEIALKVDRGSGPIFVGIAEQGSAPPSLDLTSDWKYNLYALNAGEDGSQILTISLSGLRKNEGFDLDVSYQIYAGNEPFLAKWAQFTSHRRSRFILESAVLDRWTLPDSESVRSEGCLAISQSSGTTRDGMLSAVLSDLGCMEERKSDHTLAALLRPQYPIETDRVQLTPKTVLVLYHGPAAAGRFLYQLYLAQYVARGAATGVATAYSTESLGKSISESTCLRLVPRLTSLGANLLLLYDGWQANTHPDGGVYGDWLVDRTRFPSGLTGISTTLREADMRLGLWMDVVRADPGSDVATNHPEWLYQPQETQANGEPKPSEMCFACPWEPGLADSMGQLCRELSVAYLRTHGRFERESCLVKEHSHPVGHSKAEQIEGWSDFSDRLHKVDRAFALIADQDSPNLLGQQEAAHPEGDDPLPSDNAGWLRMADKAEPGIRPPFATVGRAPCHLPVEDTNALEYCLTGALASAANLELVGDATQATDAEIAAVRKWTDWRRHNLPWLAYAQAPEVTQGAARAALHLRNLQEGRYGYLFAWQGADAGDSRIEIRPDDFALRMKTDDLAIVSVKDKMPAKFTSREGVIAVDVSLPAHGWQVYEIRSKSAK